MYFYHTILSASLQQGGGGNLGLNTVLRVLSKWASVLDSSKYFPLNLSTNKIFILILTHFHLMLHESAATGAVQPGEKQAKVGL